MGIIRKALSIGTVGAVNFFSVHEKQLMEERRQRRELEKQNEMLERFFTEVCGLEEIDEP